MEQHYDAAYAKSRAVDEHEIIADLTSETLDEAGQNTLVAAILKVIK